MPEINLRKYIGIEYKHKGRSLDGLDCWGLILMIYRDLGYELKDFGNYEETWLENKKDYSHPYKDDEWIMSSIPHPWDVALFLNKNGIAFHAGIVTPDLKIIHALKNMGVVIMRIELLIKAYQLDGYYHLKVHQ